MNQRKDQVVTDAAVDAATSAWTEAEFVKGNPASGCSVVPRVRQARCPQAPEHLEKPPGLTAPFTWSLAKPWVRAVWAGIACRLVEQGQPTVGLLVMTGLISYARPGELLRMRQCDLVPLLRGALQNFSTILAVEETGRPTKVRTFNDTLELDGLLARNFASFWTALRGPGSKAHCGPSPIRTSADSFRKR